MNAIDEFVEIIENLGGKATIDEICTQYGIKHSMVVDSTVKNEIVSIMKKLNTKIIFDSESKKWKKSSDSKSTANLPNLIKDYIDNDMDRLAQYMNEAIYGNQAIMNDFPIERIKELKIEEFVIAKEGYGNPKSFCKRLKEETRWTCSMGNLYFNAFEIYLNNGTDLTLSNTYKAKYGKDFDSAFLAIKNEIIRLLNAASNDDYETIKKCELNNQFKYKLISVYFMDKFPPCCVRKTMKEYCTRVGISYDDNSEMIDGMIYLSKWKEKYEETKNWNNWTVMSFCDTLWRNDQRL